MAQPTEFSSVSCAFFLDYNHLFVNNFCCSASDNHLVVHNHRRNFKNCFHIEVSLFLVTSLYRIQNEKTMCRLLFEYDVRLSVKLYFTKFYMNIRTIKKGFH